MCGKVWNLTVHFLICTWWIYCLVVVITLSGVIRIWCNWGAQKLGENNSRMTHKILGNSCNKQWQSYRSVFLLHRKTHGVERQSLCGSEVTWKIKKLEVKEGQLMPDPTLYLLQTWVLTCKIAWVDMNLVLLKMLRAFQLTTEKAAISRHTSRSTGCVYLFLIWNVVPSFVIRKQFWETLFIFCRH